MVAAAVAVAMAVARRARWKWVVKGWYLEVPVEYVDGRALADRRGGGMKEAETTNSPNTHRRSAIWIR